MSLVITEPPNVCDESQNCTLGSGQEFTITVELVSVPASGYHAVESLIDFGTELTYNPETLAVNEVVWGDCNVILRPDPQMESTAVSHACITELLPPWPLSHYVGTYIELSFTCSQSASTTDVSLLVRGEGDNSGAATLFLVAASPLNLQITPEVDNLTVNCVAGLPTVPTSTAGPTATHTPTPTIDPSSTETPPPTITDTPDPGATARPTDVGAPTPTLDPTVTAMTPTPTPTSTEAPNSTSSPNSTPTVNRKGTPLPTSASTPASQQVGDASCNGTVDPLDAALILQFAAGLTPALPCPSQADASRDGVVDPLDAALVLQFSAGLIDALPV